MRVHVRVLLALLALGLAGAPLGAQSLYSSAGVGLPLQPVDGRARALGSSGIGLRDASIVPADPATTARLRLPSGILVAQPSWTDVTVDGSSDHHYARGNRFPLVGAGYPVFQGMLSIYVASLFDQRFRGQRSITVDLQGTSVPALDAFSQDGSVSSLNVGYARQISGSAAVGLTIGRYAGTVSRTLTRTFQDSTLAAEAKPYQSAGSWAYSGYLVTGGVDVDLSRAVNVAASGTWSTDLNASARSGTEGADHSYTVPLQLRLGATAVLAQGLLVSASAERADWSGIRDDLGAGATARSVVLGLGVGVELSQMRLLGKRMPLRLGYRTSDLPFGSTGGFAKEQAFSGGVALTLNETNGVVLASTDLAVEKGRRTGLSFAEDFWRATVSLKLSGF